MTDVQKIAFLFPGQGAQYLGMGKDFFDNFATARQVFEEADSVLGRNLTEIIMNSSESVLMETRNSQVAIYVTSFAILCVLQELFPSLTPSSCAGLSLGEYTALSATGRMRFADGLSLVQQRGKFMNDACEKQRGTMAVILGLSAEIVEKFVKELHLPHDLWVANFNCPGQVVISGTIKGIEEGAKAAKANGAKRILPLQVHGAFHSGLMQQAEENLKSYILDTPLQESAVELVMNVVGNAVSDLAQIKYNLVKQVTSPVRWEQGIHYMGQSTDLFLEIGCGKSLTGFNKRIGVTAPTLSIEKVDDIKALETSLDQIYANN